MEAGERGRGGEKCRDFKLAGDRLTKENRGCSACRARSVADRRMTPRPAVASPGGPTARDTFSRGAMRTLSIALALPRRKLSLAVTSPLVGCLPTGGRAVAAVRSRRSRKERSAGLATALVVRHGDSVLRNA
jgi:hypothetical protein